MEGVGCEGMREENEGKREGNEVRRWRRWSELWNNKQNAKIYNKWPIL